METNQHVPESEELWLIHEKYELPAWELREKANRFTAIMSYVKLHDNDLENNIWCCLRDARAEILDEYEVMIQKAKNLKKAHIMGIRRVK